MNKIEGLFDAFLELIYPEKGICFICEEYDETVDERHICKKCFDELIFIKGNTCTICGKPLEIGYLPDRCPDCIKFKRYFEKVISPLEYTGLVKKVIYKYKYGRKAYMYKALGAILVQAFEESDIKDIDIIVPVPLHKSKIAYRGFNQSELLCRYISRKLNIPLDTKNFKRIKNTKLQNELNRIERVRNVRDAFKVVDSYVFKNKNVLLVDDIYTTGATVNECSKTLLKSGANKVYVLTLATT
ncbi:phosphoribosyltransferase [Caloranaerobacter azorensis H53214]|uniref:Phosphoribosyltransferase n=1 Tax=Caloranaerobacter azorensis H53214 TaxID=1156417 RepID=A0A096CTV5_9FIRM|nr:ComF family protein [Caloranaerobacter azorensis]KGG79974.1 phosphoribosyltransferase [Caloranaerobacter azorensis H53214]